MPAYQDYIIKSQATSGLAEITPGKVGFELALAEGEDPELVRTLAGFIGIEATSGTYCIVSLAKGLGGNIKCDFVKASVSAQLHGEHLMWERDITTGKWKCHTSISILKHTPKVCR
jgi:type IV pilus assembly protein PilA